MKTHFIIASLGSFLIMAAAPASAALLDDFNRADAGTLGSAWTQQAGSSSIVGNMATGSTASLATYNGGSGNIVAFDIETVDTGVQYVAAVLGFGTGDNYFIKVQSNGGSGAFDHLGFYVGNNGGGFFNVLATPFQSGSVLASFAGTVATLTITPNVGAQQVYTYDYGYAPTGTGIGLGFFGAARADNFADGAVAAVPEPTTWGMMIAGFGLMGAAMRRRAPVSAVRFAA